MENRCYIGKNGDTAPPFGFIIVQRCILIVHAARPADGLGFVEQKLRKRGFARVNMGKNTNGFFPKVFLLSDWAVTHPASGGFLQKLAHNGLKPFKRFGQTAGFAAEHIGKIILAGKTQLLADLRNGQATL